MGLLSLGTPMVWDEARKHADHVRAHGIKQFVNIWNKIKTRRKDHLLWGDEVEYIVVHLDEKTQRARVSLGAYDALLKLEQLEKAAIDKDGSFASSWKPEYGRYMLEGTPGAPYGATLQDLLAVEPNMRSRRSLVQSQLSPGEMVLSITNFPRLGAEDFVKPEHEPTPDNESGASRSIFISDECINPHPRFRTLTANIRTRRESKVSINMPIFKDSNTPSPFMEPAPRSLVRAAAADRLTIAVAQTCSTASKPAHTVDPATVTAGLNPSSVVLNASHDGAINGHNASGFPSLPQLVADAKPDHIYMDCMCFGMGCCCLQVTFQACSVEEARRLYDQLAVMTPIMMALSAASPIFRGYLADVDCRWDVIAASVDDRTKEERNEVPLKNSRFRIPKSRYESISTYLSPGPLYSGGCSPTNQPTDWYKEKYNDIDLVYDESIYNELLANGVDSHLAKHYAHLFIRDPLVIFNELLNVDDMISSDHFENLQSTNWQTMRFKPPPPNSKIGWRVEFRSMEVQVTDFENAAFSVFVVLLTRTILSFDLNFYIPLSLVDANMGRGVKRDAVNGQRFWFRKHVGGNEAGVPQGEDIDAIEELTIDEIINGSETRTGLVPLIRDYLTAASIPHATFKTLDSYLDLISRRASGSLPTTATFIRNFVASHDAYAGDSVVSPEITWDLMKMIGEVSNREGRVEGLSL